MVTVTGQGDNPNYDQWWLAVSLGNFVDCDLIPTCGWSILYISRVKVHGIAPKKSWVKRLKEVQQMHILQDLWHVCASTGRLSKSFNLNRTSSHITYQSFVLLEIVCSLDSCCPGGTFFTSQWVPGCSFFHQLASTEFLKEQVEGWRHRIASPHLTWKSSGKNHS